ncbi:hypothetical protein [Alteromonas sp. M12]|uniref:hypothetical protein n=1 Tax=Alteromonas sp. M12 TaxID=3135644 RepID=UPI00319E61DA
MSLFLTISLFISLFLHFTTFLGVSIFATTGYVHLMSAISFFALGATIFVERTKKYSNGKLEDKLVSSGPKYLGTTLKYIRWYIIAVFIFSLLILADGQPQIENGKYILSRQGTMIKEITYDRFLSLKRTELRLFSSLWMGFIFPAFVYFKYVVKRA